MNARVRHTGQEIRTGRLQEAMARYSLGKETMRRTAVEAGAVIKLGRVCLYDFEKLDQFMKDHSGPTEGEMRRARELCGSD